MAAGKRSKGKAERGEIMVPTLHPSVLDALEGELTPVPWFNAAGTGDGANNKYPTNVMGRFRCCNPGCEKTGWSSKKVAIFIRGYPGNGYNALVFLQRCESCNRLGKLSLDNNSYVERIVYRLKKWAGVTVAQPDYRSADGRGPHRSDLGEGCKAGYCDFDRA